MRRCESLASGLIFAQVAAEEKFSLFVIDSWFIMTNSIIFSFTCS